MTVATSPVRLNARLEPGLALVLLGALRRRVPLATATT
jgi:hypothetical protein